MRRLKAICRRLAQRFLPSTSTAGNGYRPDCLTAYYSGGEAVLCGVLLAFYFEMYGTPDTLNYPEPRTWDKSPVDLIWPGAWWIVDGQNRLTDTASWDTIQGLLPGTKNA